VSHIVSRSGMSLELSDEAMQVLTRYQWPGNVRELQNVIEQLAWLHVGSKVGARDLPPALVQSANGAVVPARERRKRVADHLYDALRTGTCSFWEQIYPMFINRDITRADIIAIVRQALIETSGNYRALVQLLGMTPSDYKRFLNFLSTHSCTVDFREFRSGGTPRERLIEPLIQIPAVRPAAADADVCVSRPA